MTFYDLEDYIHIFIGVAIVAKLFYVFVLREKWPRRM